MNPKIAIVTGAGSGIGRATALALLRNGYAVVLAGRRREALLKTQSVAEGDAVARTLIVPTDVSDPSQVENAATMVEERFGPIGIVKFQGHARDDQQQETGHDQEMKQPFEGHKTREPFIVHLRVDLGFAEFLGIVRVKVNRTE